MDEKKYLVVLKADQGLSTRITYEVEQGGVSELDAAFRAGRRMEKFPDCFPLPSLTGGFIVESVTEVTGEN